MGPCRSTRRATEHRAGGCIALRRSIAPSRAGFTATTATGRFSDVTNAAGLATQFGPALGVSTADFDGDGWIDIYVANDREENQLWINRHDGTFVNRALLSGTALGPFGEAEIRHGRGRW